MASTQLHIHALTEKVAFPCEDGILVGHITGFLSHRGMHFAEVETEVGVYDVLEWQLMGVEEAIR